VAGDDRSNNGEVEDWNNDGLPVVAGTGAVEKIGTLLAAEDRCNAEDETTEDDEEAMST